MPRLRASTAPSDPTPKAAAPSPAAPPAPLPPLPADADADTLRRDLIAAIADGWRSRQWALARGVGRSTVGDWLMRHPELRAAIDASRDEWCADVLREAVEIADAATPETERVDRLRIDARVRAAAVWLSSGRARASSAPGGGAAQDSPPSDVAAAAAILAVLHGAQRRPGPAVTVTATEAPPS